MSSSLDRELSQQLPAHGPGLLTAARRHPLVVVAAVVVAVALAALVSLALPVTYTAQARLVLGDQNDATVFRNVAGLNPTAKAQNAAQVMRSPEIYERASQLLDGKVTPSQIENGINVTPADNNPLVTITSTAGTANRSRAMANAVGQAYLDLTKEQSQTRGERARTALKALQQETVDTLDAVNEQVSERVDKIRRKAAQTVEAPAERGRFVQSQLSTDTKYIALRSQADRLTQNLAEVRQKLLESRVDQELVSAGIDTLYKADEPSNPTSPNLRRNLLIGAAIGLLAGLGPRLAPPRPASRDRAGRGGRHARRADAGPRPQAPRAEQQHPRGGPDRAQRPVRRPARPRLDADAAHPPRVVSVVPWSPAPSPARARRCWRSTWPPPPATTATTSCWWTPTFVTPT